jgi:hypothetical protein
MFISKQIPCSKYSLNPWSRVLPGGLIVSVLVNKYPVFMKPMFYYRAQNNIPIATDLIRSGHAVPSYFFNI